MCFQRPLFPAIGRLCLGQGLFLLLACGSTSGHSDVQELCGRYENTTSPSGQYTFNTNIWGADGSGGQCVTLSNNLEVFNSTWKWSDNHLDVHSFPNINLNSPLLPIELSTLGLLNITANWTLTPTKPKKGKGLSSISTSADVIVDMFLDPDKHMANSTTLPKYEVMVWIATFGGKKPIGYSASFHAPKQWLDDTEFSLYEGANTHGQYVYSWLASFNIHNFSADISPLLHFLWQEKYINEATYLGVVQFGTETFHATQNVTFSAHHFNLDLSSGTPIAAVNLTNPDSGMSGDGSGSSSSKKSNASMLFPLIRWIIFEIVFVAMTISLI